MIVDAIIGILVAVFTGILGLLPAYQLPASIGTLGAEAGSAVSAANGVFPVATLGVCILLMIGARLFIAGFAVVAWVYDKIPFKFS